MPIPTPAERLGQLVAGRYLLETILSTGGMGIVYRGLDRSQGTAVAIKTLKPGHAYEPEKVGRFMREARVMRALDHENIARVIDVRQDDQGVPFLIMELLEGRSLDQELEERGVIPFSEALARLMPIARALSHAHQRGVIHRDIKPSNIFLSQRADGTLVPKLLDFGIAKALFDGFETQTGQVLGTPAYMAPEQVQYAECGPFTDVWGVAAVLYRAVTGKAPHQGGSASHVIGKLMREPVPPFHADGVSKPACAIIDRALSQDPHRRYQTADELVRALTGALEGKKSDADATLDESVERSGEPREATIDFTYTAEQVLLANGASTPSPRRRRRGARSAFIAGCVALSLVFSASLWRRETAPFTRLRAGVARELSELRELAARSATRVSTEPLTAPPSGVTSVVPRASRARDAAQRRTAARRTRSAADEAAAPPRPAEPGSGEQSADLPIATQW